ncbi:hypothetical protein [Bacillus wiedmannii]|uniref:hypothetical protein n=1 Tax=Bacillus wiedmannii TaxID=1890302 RepID=UPI001F0A9237|nr:hypothetical protein [Bacillus wiedmannii]
MSAAIMEVRKEELEITYEVTAWQTALLMNATGNFKKLMTPDKLLGKDSEGKPKEDVVVIGKEERDKRLKELLAKFE